jgi:type I restriction enzyme R subunit
VTFRLKDSLPQAKLREWKHQRHTWLLKHLKPWDEATQASYHREFTVTFEH